MMIFTRTKRAAQRLADELEDRGFKATSIHGDLSQVLREKALKKFRDGKVDVLVATDVAARGIDITDVTHVVNYECPDDEKTYVHRIGRTGRAGATGVAITFVDWADTTRWKVINKSLGLPFSEIPETYSTSEHLHTDHDIPKGTKGRLKPPAPREPKEPRDSHGEHGHHARTERPREQRPPRDRSRRRLRNGEPVDSLDSTSAVATASAVDTPEAVAATATAEAAAEAPARRRRRRRPAASTD